jgi:hypothetical protein
MAKALVTAGGNAVWEIGKPLVAKYQSTRTVKVDGEDRPMLTFSGPAGEVIERWGSHAFTDLVKTGNLKTGMVLSMTAHPKRGKGKKQFCPFDIIALEPGDAGYFN